MAGKFFSVFFFLDRVGELAAAAEEEKVFWFFLYLFLEGAFLVLLLLLLSLLLGSTWLFLFLSRAGEFGRGSEREERKERKAV